MAMGDYLPGYRRAFSPREGSPLNAMQRQLDRMLEGLFSEYMPTAGSSAAGFNPRINYTEHEREIIISAELPGMEEKDIDVQLTGNGLLLKGERRKETREEDQKTGRQYVEQSYGMFERLIPIESEVDEDKVEATFKNGMLRIVLPKSEDTIRKSRKVAIKGEGKSEEPKPPSAA